MRHSRYVVVSAVLLAGILVLQGSIGKSVLYVLRFPFSCLRESIKVLALLPDLPSVVQENNQLNRLLIEKKVEIVRLKEQLRQLNSIEAYQSLGALSSGIVASVISRSLIPTQHSIHLNRGAGDGLALNSAILDIHGVVGRVLDIQSNTCTVILITDRESRISAMIERSRETGLLVGLSMNQCELIYLDADSDIEVNDSIVTAGLGGIFPKGLLLGKVAAVSRNEQTGTAYAEVRPAAKLGKIEEVFCLLPE